MHSLIDYTHLLLPQAVYLLSSSLEMLPTLPSHYPHHSSSIYPKTLALLVPHNLSSQAPQHAPDIALILMHLSPTRYPVADMLALPAHMLVTILYLIPLTQIE